MAANNHELKAGSRLIMTLTADDTGQVLLEEEHEVVEASSEAQRTRGLPRGMEGLTVETRLVSRQWHDPELQRLNEAPAGTGGLRGGGAGAAEATKLGLEIAKFAWDVVKDNKAVANAKATTTSVLCKGTGGLDYESARPTKAPTYTLSVHDSLIKSWELIHAEIACEGTYGATPRTAGVPEGHYLPAVHVYAPKASADFPCQVDVSATLSEVSNLGTGPIDPQITILVGVDYGWIAQRRHLTLKYTARGSQGLRRG